MLKAYLILVGSLLLSFGASAIPNSETIVVCYPGASVNVKVANGAMNAMQRVVERGGQWPLNIFNSLFTSKADECRKQMVEMPPKFAIISLCLYLELRILHNLVPLVQPKIKGRTNERYRIMAQKEMKRAIDLNPDIDDGGSLRILGALYLKAPAWPNGIGDPDKALELLEMAIKKYPEHPLNHLFYAQVLWEDNDKAFLSKVKAEFALGEKLLSEGNWGCSKEPWKKEFDAFRQGLNKTESDT